MYRHTEGEGRRKKCGNLLLIIFSPSYDGIVILQYIYNVQVYSIDTRKEGICFIIIIYSVVPLLSLYKIYR